MSPVCSVVLAEPQVEVEQEQEVELVPEVEQEQEVEPEQEAEVEQEVVRVALALLRIILPLRRLSESRQSRNN